MARAAITEPRVLLLDEPLSALDEFLRIQMRQELRSMQRDLGITFVHVTHTQLEAIALADLVVVMEKGKIRQAGPREKSTPAPKDRYVAEFLGGQNVLSGQVRTVNGHHAVFAAPTGTGITVPLTPGVHVDVGDPITIAVRRDDIEIVGPGHAPHAGDKTASVSSRVTAIEYQGYFVKVMLDAGNNADFVVYVSERKFFTNPVNVGDAVLATWPVDHARILASRPLATENPTMTVSSRSKPKEKIRVRLSNYLSLAISSCSRGQRCAAQNSPTRHMVRSTPRKITLSSTRLGIRRSITTTSG